MTTRLSGIALAGLIAAFGMAACGGDDGETKSPSKGDDKTPSRPSGSVECGPELCAPKEGFTGEMCCQSPFDGLCGQMVAGTCVDLPPDSDERCEPTTFMAGGNQVMVPSCCTDDGQCGLLFSAGIGPSMCTSITQARQFGARFMAMGQSGMTMMFDFSGSLPEAVTCDGEPIEPPAAGSGG